ncbi:hypothetical protein PHMEG_0002856 [Phytophthora megakarya]|uniref:Uncharacterized protein n=1 Tax=Phytophthora megakarya TaxID=4795 RepID=A0A225WZH3_9STRA|nr:hypothetical protein PHMEG_0002856 [Phytophthora megakarya]
MTILCDWMKRRQLIVHGFQHELHQPPTSTSPSHESSTHTNPKATSNAGCKPQLWDVNGRSIGIKPQHDI